MTYILFKTKLDVLRICLYTDLGPGWLNELGSWIT